MARKVVDTRGMTNARTPNARTLFKWTIIAVICVASLVAGFVFGTLIQVAQ